MGESDRKWSAGVLVVAWAVAAFEWSRMSPAHLLWACDVSLLLTAIALFVGSSRLLTAQMTLLVGVHTFWWVDFLSVLVADVAPFGFNSYMFFRDLSFGQKALSLFNHLAVVPLGFAGLRQLGVHQRGWHWMALQCAVLGGLSLGFAASGEIALNWALGSRWVTPPESYGAWVVYFALLIAILPFALYWPTNRFLSWLLLRDRWTISLRPVSALPVLFALTWAFTWIADHKCRLPEELGLDRGLRSARLRLPEMPLKTPVHEVRSPERGAASIPVQPWVLPLPTSWSAKFQEWIVSWPQGSERTRGELCPDVGPRVVLRGERAFPGSQVWGFVAFDRYYFTTVCDSFTDRQEFEVPLRIGDSEPDGRVNPKLGNSSETYAIGVVEVLEGRVVSRSPYYLVERRASVR